MVDNNLSFITPALFSLRSGQRITTSFTQSLYENSASVRWRLPRRNRSTARVTMLSSQRGGGGTVKTMDPFGLGFINRRAVDEERLRRILWKAKALEKEGDLKGTIDVFEALLTEFPDCGKGWLLYAKSLQRNKRLDDSREVLKRGLKANPANGILWQNWADLEKGAGRTEIARKLFKKGLEANSMLPSLYHSWGGMEYKQGNVNTARRLYRQGLKKCPKSCWLYHALAILEDKQGNSEVARSLLTRSLHNCPNDAHLLHALGVLEYREGNVSKAREWFSNALKVDPRSGMTILSWARLEEATGNSDVARKYYRMGTNLQGGGSVQLWQAWARMEQKFGNVRDAIELYYSATQIHSKDTQLHCSWAKLLVHHGEPAKAQMIFNKGLDIDKHYAPFWQGLALLEESQYRVDAARRCYEKGAELGRGKGVAALLHSWAALEWRTGNEQKARDLFRQALTVEPKSAWLWLWYGSFELSCRNVELARHYFCRSINIDGKDASAWRSWAALEADQGNEERAKALKKKAAELEGVRAMYDRRLAENPLYRYYERFP